MKKLYSEPQTYQFEQATVVYSAERSAVTTVPMPRLHVQMTDQYGFHRELCVEYLHRAGNANERYWQVHAYRHMGRRHIQEVSHDVAVRFIERFLHICAGYRDLLFNYADNAKGEPRSRGFVHLSERLLDGEPFSIRLLC
jgi:hypothetical protein